MKNKTNVLKSLTAAAAVPALLLGVAACGDSGEETVNNATEQAGDAANSATEKAGDAAASATSDDDDNDSDDDANDDDADEKEQTSSEKPEIQLNGKPVKGDFTPVKIKHETDDGQKELKYEAGQDDSNELDVEIIEGDKPALSGLSLKVDGKEWETSDQQEREAKVKKSGDKYTVTTDVHEDDNEQNTASVEVTFSVAQ